jgi:DMSO/TMAO reductase YedYZ heme-binding membrane subunit
VGAASWYLLFIVILTSLFRLHIARPLWRKLHYLVFPSFVLMFIHSMFTDPSLSTGRVDWLDGGKLFVEICSVISVAAWTMRIRLRGRGFRQQS